MKKVIVTLFLTAFLTVTSHAGWQANGVAICDTVGGQGYPTIVSDGSGGAIITWFDYRSSTNTDIYAQKVNASGVVQWPNEGVAICDTVGNQWAPVLTPDGKKGAIITWYDSRNGNNDIFVQRIDSAGVVQWTANGVPICIESNGQGFQEIISDGAGGAIITWVDTRNGNNDIYAQRVNNMGIIQWQSNGIAICDTTGEQQYPAITADDSGGAIITWTDWRSGGIDIYAQRVSSSGVTQWQKNGVAICKATGEQGNLDIISDAAYGAIITWGDYRSGNWDIYAQRVNSSGTVQWTTNGVGVSVLSNAQMVPKICTDGANGAIITWYDWRKGTETDIYAQRVNSLGSAQWTVNGLEICTATERQFECEISSDDAGGALITWEDLRNSTKCIKDQENDIYAQRVNDLGVVQWTTNGVAVCTVTGFQQYPMITSDDANGAIIAWEDFRGDGDIYAQRFDSLGSMGVATESAHSISMAFVLYEAYPNPSQGATTFKYQLPKASDVQLDIFNVTGQLVKRICQGTKLAGYHQVLWNADVPNGVYLCRLTSGSYNATKKLIVLK